MVGFPTACQTRYGANPQIIYLSDNHRSDSNIVQWCSNYITSFPKWPRRTFASPESRRSIPPWAVPEPILPSA